MKKILLALLFAMLASPVFAKVDIVDLFTDALLTSDVAELEKTLAPNFWYIGANGHIRDKEHFIEEIRDRKLVINRIKFTNLRESTVGQTRLLTSNGVFQGKSDMPLPYGLMRYTLVLGDNHGKEQVVLFQATPVIATHDCADGNCRIK